MRVKGADLIYLSNRECKHLRTLCFAVKVRKVSISVAALNSNKLDISPR